MKTNGTPFYAHHGSGGDPALGRFGQVDPKASKYGAVSPYHFAGNDPVGNNDPMGDDYRNEDFERWYSSHVTAGQPHDTNDPFRMYRGSDPYGTSRGRWLYADHLERLTHMNREYDMKQDKELIRQGKMTEEEYAAKYGTNVHSSQFAGYASAANFAKRNYLLGLSRLIGLVKHGMFLEAAQTKKIHVISYKAVKIENIEYGVTHLSFGVAIQLGYDGDDIYTEHNWVQTVNSNYSVDETKEPGFKIDGFPGSAFYYEMDAQSRRFHKQYSMLQGYPEVFDDAPSMFKSSSGSTFFATTSLVGKANDGTWHALGTLTWGFGIQNGTMHLYNYKFVQPSGFHQNVLDNLN